MTTPPKPDVVSEERLAYLIAAHADKDNWGYSPETVVALRELLAAREEIAELKEVWRDDNSALGKALLELEAAREELAALRAEIEDLKLQHIDDMERMSYD